MTDVADANGFLGKGSGHKPRLAVQSQFRQERVNTPSIGRGPLACARSWQAVRVPRNRSLEQATERPKTHAEVMASRDGYFAPESVIRGEGNSPLVPMLGGGPAVLLQVAHPLVAAGVVYHSDYHEDLWRRLLRTLQ